MIRVPPTVQAPAKDFPGEQAAARLEHPHIARGVGLTPGFGGNDGRNAIRGILVPRQPVVGIVVAPCDRGIVQCQPERGAAAGGMARRAGSLEDGLDVAMEFHVEHARAQLLHHGVPAGIL